LGKIAKSAVVGTVVALAVVYVGDLLWVRLRMAYPKAGGAFASVRMERLYAIPQKSGKTEHEFDVRQPEVVTPCVRSLLPHMGYSPCWYLRRNSQKPIPM
jgi:hypothetical protein